MKDKKGFGILRLYGGESGKIGYYNLQELGLARALRKYGYTVYIFFPAKTKKIQELYIEDGIMLIYLPARIYGSQSIFNVEQLSNYSFEILQIQSDNQVMTPTVSAYCRRNHIHYYYYVGIIESHSNSSWKRRVMNCLFQRNLKCMRNAQVFTKTKTVKEQLIQNGIEQPVLVPVGLDMTDIPLIETDKNTLRKELNLPANKKLLIFVGRLEADKRPLDLLGLMPDLKDKYALVMIGKGSLKEEVERYIVSENLSECVYCIDEIPNQELHLYLKAADYYINLNEREIFGMGILEAMYQGCVVIARKAPGPLMIIDDGRDGFLVETDSEIVDKLQTEVGEIPNRAHEKIVREFNWETSCQRLLEKLSENSDKE